MTDQEILSISASDAHKAGLFDHSKTLTGEDRIRVYPYDTLSIRASGAVFVGEAKIHKLDKKGLELAHALAHAVELAEDEDGEFHEDDR